MNTPGYDDAFMNNRPFASFTASIVCALSIGFVFTAFGSSAVAVPVSAQTNAAGVSAPHSVTAQVTGTAQITVSWSVPSDTAGQIVDGYAVYEFPGNNKPIIVASPQTFATFGDRKPGVTYSFYVRARTSSGNGQPSNWSNSVRIPIPGEGAAQPPEVVNPPQGVVAVVSGEKQITVSWQKALPRTNPTKGQTITSYRVTQTPGAGVIVVPGVSTEATFLNLDRATTYVFSVQTIQTNKKSSVVVLSNPIVIAPAPAAPIVTATTIVAPTIAATTVPPVAATVPNPSSTPVASVPPNRALPAFVEPTAVGRVSTCVKTPWSDAYTGTPAQFATGANIGVFLWFDGRVWHIRAYNPGPNPVVFTGTVTMGGVPSKFYPTLLETTDIVRASRTKASFSFSSNYDVDALRVSSGCARTMTVSVAANGAPLSKSQIFVGSTGINATTDGQITVKR